MQVDLDFLNKRPLSFSSIKEFEKSPAHYVQYVNSKREPSDAMKFGSLVHALILEPDTVSSRFFAMPDVDRRTSDGKSKWKEAEEMAEGKETVTSAQWNNAHSMIHVMNQSDEFNSVISKLKHKERRFEYELSGLPFTGYIDGEADDFFLEIKTIDDASYSNVQRRFSELKYHWQAGLYSEVTGKKCMYLIIQTGSVFDFGFLVPDQEFIEIGKYCIKKAANNFLGCMIADGFNVGIDWKASNENTLLLPGWMTKVDK
jgi:hypothetical protein